jgi:phenylalanyl-tRNA synthetase alpha subunit
MKYKDKIEQELKNIGFDKIFYSQEEFDKIANAYSNIGSENYSKEEIDDLIEILENEKFCLVQNVILDKKVINADVFFMSVKDVSSDILDNLLLTDMKVSISPLKEDLSNVSIDFVTNVEEDK